MLIIKSSVTYYKDTDFASSTFSLAVSKRSMELSHTSAEGQNHLNQNQEMWKILAFTFTVHSNHYKHHIISSSLFEVGRKNWIDWSV